MRKTKIALAVLMAVVIVLGTFFVIKDAVERKGYNWQTTQEYRWNISEGK